MPKVIDLSLYTEFEWDDANRKKNLVEHNVNYIECEQVFVNKQNLVQYDQNHSHVEDRFSIVGMTNIGRFLTIIFTIRRGKIRVISARDQSRRERIFFKSLLS